MIEIGVLAKGSVYGQEGSHTISTVWTKMIRDTGTLKLNSLGAINPS